MLNKMKVAAKIGVGFGLVIAIAAVLGAVELWNILGVQGEATRLDKETVPQVAVANNIERSVQGTMYNMQGYLQSMDTDSLDQVKQFMSDARKYLADAESLATKYPRLIVLRKNAAEARSRVEEYDTLIQETVSINASIIAERMNQSASGSTFNTNLQNYILKKTADLDALIGGHAAIIGQKSTLQEITLANEVRDLGNMLRIGNFETQATSDPGFLKDAMQSFADVEDRITSWRALPTVGRNDLVQLDAIAVSGKAYLQASQTVLNDLVKRAEVNAAQRKTADVVLEAAVQTSLEGFKDAATITTLTVARLMTAILSLVLGIAAATIMGVAIAIAITRTITRPLFKGVAFAQQIANGDFTTRLDIRQRDELGVLADALNEMADKLRNVVISVQKSAARVAQSSGAISANAEKLAEGAQSQASTLEQTSASVQELVASVDQVSEHAQAQAAAVEEGSSSMAMVQNAVEGVSRSLGEIFGLAQKSAQNAVEGDKAVQSVMDVITLIAGGSEKIGGIVGVISDIADQTNLLALNAAIEAARAGEHGRGFAVVADEVSKLAERSASSTKEIEGLIRESVRNVGQGVTTARGSQLAMEQIRAASQQVNETITALSASMEEQVAAIRELASALGNVSEMSQGISAATEEQASNAKQVSKAVETVTELTQAAAASAAEMSVSTAELTTMAQGLNGLVAQFKIGQGDVSHDGSQENAPERLIEIHKLDRK